MPKNFLVVGGATGTIEEAATETSAGAGDSDKLVHLDATGKFSTTVMPAGVGPNTVNLTAGETVAAGDLIYLDGTSQVFKADANDPAKQAAGYVLSGITASATGDVFFGSGINTGMSGLTPGAQYFLSEVTPGGVVLVGALPTGSGDIVQPVGHAIDATTLSFEPQRATVLV